MIQRIFLLVFSLAYLQTIVAQDLLGLLENETDSNQPVIGTFKGTRVINGHSVDTRKAGVLDFMISHRFGVLSSGAYNFWGLDNANIRLALEYALTDRITAGVGRNSYEKTYDFFIKDRLMIQTAGKSPISVTFLNSFTIKTLRNPTVDLGFSDKLANTAQLLIARKFGPNLSLQIMPTYIHINTIDTFQDNNSGLAVGLAGRYKLTQRLAVNMEYYPQIQRIDNDNVNAFAVGFDIETGGHVFQLHLTNATAMIEKGFIGETYNNFGRGDIHFGFNISRAFQLR